MIEIYINRKSIRLKNYDYSQNGMYYVTICTKNRENLLSNITAVGANASVCPKNKNKNKYKINKNTYTQIKKLNYTTYVGADRDVCPIN